MEMLTARIGAARIISPKGEKVSMEIGDRGYVGMVDRDVFDPWLRERAGQAGAARLTGTFDTLAYREDGTVALTVAVKGEAERTITTRMVIGADGANSAVRRTIFGPKKRPPYVFAYHEIVKSPPGRTEAFDPDCCDVVYDGRVSPDFYGWVFPHGEHTSVGVGSAVKGHSLKEATRKLREDAGLADAETIRVEGAPLPLKPMRRWDDGRAVLLIGDAAGVVAPSSGEGIYYAMLTGELGADATEAAMASGGAKALKSARKRFMKEHGRVFFVLGLLQRIWYSSDKRREQFVKMCRDPDVQRLTWESYLNKKLVKQERMAHFRVFIKDMQQLLGLTAR